MFNFVEFSKIIHPSLIPFQYVILNFFLMDTWRLIFVCKDREDVIAFEITMLLSKFILSCIAQRLNIVQFWCCNYGDCKLYFECV